MAVQLVPGGLISGYITYMALNGLAWCYSPLPYFTIEKKACTKTKFYTQIFSRDGKKVYRR